jgi:hypothetical protein
MGIPSFTSRLTPYLQPFELGCANGACSSRRGGLNVVIDGPSLAFHVFHRLVNHNVGIDGQPSYEELTMGVVVFLDELLAGGLVM